MRAQRGLGFLEFEWLMEWWSTGVMEYCENCPITDCGTIQAWLLKTAYLLQIVTCFFARNAG